MAQNVCRRMRIERHTSPASEIADARKRTIKMIANLRVDGNDLGTCVCIGIEERVRIRNHKVRIEHLVGDMAERLDDGRAECQVGHEMPIHHIKVDPVGTGAVDGSNLIG